MNFQEAERRYAEIKRRQETGGLTQEEFDEELKQLMVRDEEGRWWVKSRSAGEWYYHDGTAWVKDTPPSYQPPTPTPPMEEPPPSDRSGPEQAGPLSAEEGVGERRAPATQAEPDEQTPAAQTEPPLTQTTPVEGPPVQDAQREERRGGVIGMRVALGCLVAVVGLVVLLAIIGSTTGPTTPPNPGNIVRDEFNVHGNWALVKTEDASVEYDQRSLQMAAYSPETGVASLMSDSLDREDVIVEVDATKASRTTNEDDGWGPVCRAQDYDNYYIAQLYADGSAALWKKKDDEWHALSDRSDASDAFRGQTATNHIRFDCVGNELTMYVNDQKVVWAEDSDFKSGNVGLFLSSPTTQTRIEVSFDNFLVSSP